MVNKTTRNTDNAALLLVDVQKDFCPGGALAVQNGDEVVAPLNAMVRYAEASAIPVFASRDWHPAKTKHFAPKEKGGAGWPVHCVADTPGAEFHDDLEVLEALVISKGFRRDEDGYSAFDGAWLDDPVKRPFARVLDDLDIGTLYIGGLAIDYCVKASALDATKRGFRVVLLKDACRAVNINPNDEEKAIKEMEEAGVIISSTKEVIDGSM